MFVATPEAGEFTRTKRFPIWVLLDAVGLKVNISCNPATALVEPVSLVKELSTNKRASDEGEVVPNPTKPF